MSFGKRNTDRHGEGAQGAPVFRDLSVPIQVDTARISRLLVFAVGGIVLLGAISTVAMHGLPWGTREPFQVEASLVDGSANAATSISSVVQMCTEERALAASAGDGAGDEARTRAAKSCRCAIEAAASQLTPLQMQMLYIDQRTRLRATMARIDRTGETFAVGAVPRVEIREGAAVALVTADSYEAHWREANGVMAQQTARCPS